MVVIAKIFNLLTAFSDRSCKAGARCDVSCLTAVTVECVASFCIRGEEKCFKAVGREEGGPGESQRLELCIAIIV